MKRAGLTSIVAAAFLGSFACGDGGTEPPPPPARTVTVQSLTLSPNPVNRGKPFSATPTAVAQNTSIDSIALTYANERQKIAGNSGVVNFTASQSGPVCATAYGTGATPNTKCETITINPASVSVNGTIPAATPLINKQFAVSANATGTNATIDSVDAIYKWNATDSARIVARGTNTLSGNFTARRPGTITFHAYSRDAPTAEDAKAIGVNVPLIIELRAFYRDSLTGIGPGPEVQRTGPPSNGIVVDSLDKSQTTATMGGNTVNTNDGFLRSVVPYGTITVGNVSSPDRFKSERYVTKQANGDSTLTWTWARRPTTDITIDENSIVQDTARVKVYRIAPSPDPKRLNFQTWPIYNNVYAGNGAENYPPSKDIHTGFTYPTVTIEIYTGTDTIRTNLPCKPTTQPAILTGARLAAARAKGDFDDADISIDIVETNTPTVVPGATQGTVKVAPGKVLLCESKETPYSTYRTEYDSKTNKIIAWQGSVPNPPVPMDSTQILAYRYSYMQEIYNGFAGGLSEHPLREITWFSSAGGFSGGQGLSPFDRDVVRIVNRYFMRPIQRMRETQSAAGQAMWPAYRLELPTP